MRKLMLAALLCLPSAAMAQSLPSVLPGDSQLTVKCEGNLSVDQAYALARKWVDAWNSTDVNVVMALYTQDFEFRAVGILNNPNIANPSGILHGQDNNRLRWFGINTTKSAGSFRLIDAYAGVRSTAVHYLNKIGQQVTEVMEYTPDCKIERSNALYGPVPPGVVPTPAPNPPAK
jgi:hypothetical protein